MKSDWRAIFGPALTTAVAYLGKHPAWYRGVVVASSIPVAMSANVARVVLTGFIMHGLDPEYASGAFHTVEGLLMMGFGLFLLRGLDRLGNAPVPLNGDAGGRNAIHHVVMPAVRECE